MKASIHFIIGFLLLFFSNLAFSGHLTSKEVERDIEKLGAKATVEKLDRGEYPTQWDWMMEQAGKGKAEWLNLLKPLYEGADAARAEGITITLARALPKNPHRVLALVREEGKHPFTIENVCTMPFIEPESEFIRDYFRETREALRKLSAKDVLEEKQLCLRILENANIATEHYSFNEEETSGKKK